MFSEFTNLYPLNKTLRFGLRPIAETEENFLAAKLLEQDQKRAEDYVKVKGYMDRYYRLFIERVLSQLDIQNISSYAELYYKINKSDEDKNMMDKIEEGFRMKIATSLRSDAAFSKVTGEKFVTELLPTIVEEDELDIVKKFVGFTTYFQGFWTNRKNMFSDEKKASAIGNRCITDNLPRFLDNCQSFRKIADTLGGDEFGQLDSLVQDWSGFNLKDAFCVDYFRYVLPQSGIDFYNSIIGGVSLEDGTKIKGVNEYVNLYNQQLSKEEKNRKLPLLKPLYKQILSDRITLSFVVDKFESDNDVVKAIYEYYTSKETGVSVEESINAIDDLFRRLSDYDLSGIYVNGGRAVTDLSQAVYGDWSALENAWKEEYEALHPVGKNKNKERYLEEQKKAYKACESFSVEKLQSMKASENALTDIASVISVKTSDLVGTIKQNYAAVEPLLRNGYTSDKRMASNEETVELIKNFLDSIKMLEHWLSDFTGTGKEEYKDNAFYGAFLGMHDTLSTVDRLYDKVRNYLTQKFYSKDKIKLNFENPQFLGGWDRNKETDYRTVLLKKDGHFYLAVMDKKSNKLFENDFPIDEESNYEKIDYKLLPGPNKMLPKVFFAQKNIRDYAPDDEIMRIRKKESYKYGPTFNIDDCHKFIDFYKACIRKNKDWHQFGFSFSPTENYNNIGEFFREVKDQGYKLTYRPISEKYIAENVANGSLYLFEIYNKDFSESSKGKPNLHTMYFRMLFDEKNLRDVVYQLNGGAEMFYRLPSISEAEKIIHKANAPIKNKNSKNEKAESVFSYDIIKNRRYTERRFFLHLPIVLNFKAASPASLNEQVRLALQKNDTPYVVGIDRGERNLLYACVIDSKGNIVKQVSLNEIYSDNGYVVDYHDLLDKKEASRATARRSWKSIENIKELKEGYLSQAVHTICQLAVEYNAIIVLEDLNFGFKKGRFKVEKQVYQKFENMLISKLNYLVDKTRDADATGGLLHAYQLTNKQDGLWKGSQNGILFYVPAYLTSKIDPTTGFVDLLKPKYTSVAASKEFIRCIDAIRYDTDEKMFVFDIDYAKFPKGDTSYKKNWTLYSYGDRIRRFRNKENNNEWDYETIQLTDAFLKLFEKYNISIERDIKDQLLKKEEGSLFAEFLNLFALMLQMRNSISGNVEVDYLVSPVKNETGVFYDSRNYEKTDASLPANADANGAYNIARKGMWAVNVIKNTKPEDIKKIKFGMTNKEWLEFAQS